MDDPGLIWRRGGAQPLVSIVVTLWSLALLYLPGWLLVFSPVLVAGTALFLVLLRCSAAQGIDLEPEHVQEPEPEPEASLSSKSEVDFQKPLFVLDSFVEWDVRAPLEVIYEEESENEDGETAASCLRRHTSLSRYFPESDSDTSDSDEYPDWDSPGRAWFKWDEEETNGLIEISLESKKAADFETEENMIEIDISPASPFQIPAS
uniref:Uncharacterized protein n=1 Tax=Kalanchoe fedtschenkoi TaxID=63787 RepID=A0A7N0VNA5_KALFE